MFADAVRERLLGAYRILFPVASPGSGYVVWARVSAVLKDALDDSFPPVVVAPSTFFEPINDDKRSFEDLQRDLPNALRTFGLEGKATVDCVYVVELIPVRAADFSRDDAVANRVLAELTPPALQVSGPSLGLAVSLAAWAAAERLSVAPVIASGMIDGNGTVLPVDLVPDKLKGALKFRSDIDPACKILLPAGNSIAVPPGMSAEVAFVDSPEMLPQLLTDGLDEYRRLWQVGVAS